MSRRSIIVAFVFGTILGIAMWSIRPRDEEALAVPQEPSPKEAPDGVPITLVRPPDGWGGIVFSGTREGNTDLFIIQPDRTGLRRLTTDPAADEQPVWSHDGERIVFHSERDGQWEIYSIAPDGTALVRHTDHPAPDRDPCWTRDGSRIVFASERDGSWQIYSVAADDPSDLVRITRESSRPQFLPAVSPVDDLLVYTRRAASGGSWEICSMPLHGGEPRVVSPGGGCRAKWSPDGQRLAYVSQGIFDRSDIWTFGRDGGEPRRITKTPEYDYDPCWSPDGREICFARGREGKAGWDLWIIGVDGTNLRYLTNLGAGDRFPDWR